MKVISYETIIKVCELLEIDPDSVTEIHIDLNSVTVTKWHGLISRRGEK